MTYQIACDTPMGSVHVWEPIGVSHASWYVVTLMPTLHNYLDVCKTIPFGHHFVPLVQKGTPIKGTVLFLTGIIVHPVRFRSLRKLY